MRPTLVCRPHDWTWYVPTWNKLFYRNKQPRNRVMMLTANKGSLSLASRFWLEISEKDCDGYKELPLRGEDLCPTGCKLIPTKYGADM